jgi:DNA-binding CsgD family transcriptional regulator
MLETSPVLLEREPSIRAITELIERAAAGTGQALFLVGEAGLGKTALLREAAARSGPNVRVGWGQGDPLEANLPFALLGQAIDHLGGPSVLDPAAIARNQQDLRATRFFATLRWLQTSTPSPVLLGLDDLHWADPDSVALLSFLCRRIRSLPVAVIGTLRPWPPGAHEVCCALAHGGFASMQRLEPLSEEASTELLARRLGRRVDPPTARSAWTLCAGNPLLLEELAHACGGTGLGDPATGWSKRLSNDVVLARFAGLDSLALRCARAACALGVRFRPDIAAELAELDGPEAAAAHEALERSGISRPLPGGWMEFVHPLFSQGLYDQLGVATRRQLHARGFRLLARRGMTAEAAEHAIRGQLHGDAEAVAALHSAGLAALDAGAPATAAERLGAAVELAGASIDAELLRVDAEALLATGRAADAVAVCERLLGEDDALRRGEALRLLGRALYFTGAHQQAMERFAEAAHLLETAGPSLAVQALLDLARQSWRTRGIPSALPLLDRARRLAETAPPAIRRRAEVAWGYLTFLGGDPSGLEPVEAAARQLQSAPLSDVADLCWTWGALRNFGNLARFSERLSDAERALTVALSAAEEVGATGAIASLADNVADTLLRLGRLDEALAVSMRVLEMAELVPWIEPFAAAGRASALLHLGRQEDEDWEASCHRAEERAVAREEWLALLCIWHVRGQHRLREGRLAEAADLYLRIAEVSRRLGIGEPCMVPWARHAVDALTACDRLAEAGDVLAWLDECSVRMPCRWPRIAAAIGRARLAERRGDPQEVTACVERALHLLDEAVLPLEAIEVRLDAGGLLRRAGRRSRARGLLADALDAAESIGASWLAGHARQELAVAGGRRHRLREERELLTPQEQRVAQLTTEGYSNDEIARRLCVTIHTVHTHLKRIYAKLEVRSRYELIAAAQRSAPMQRRGSCAEDHPRW